MNLPHDALFQNCINGSTPLNRRAATAPDKKSFKQHLLNHWPKFKIISQNCSYNTLYQNCTNGSAPLNKRAARALDKNIFKQHFLHNHWSKFKIISQNCFLIIHSTKIFISSSLQQKPRQTGQMQIRQLRVFPVCFPVKHFVSSTSSW